MELVDLLLFYLTKWMQKKIWFLLNTRSFTGFIDLWDTVINTLNFEKKEDFATHALVYFVRGVFSDLKSSS